jgi:hypothetical protein
MAGAIQSKVAADQKYKDCESAAKTRNASLKDLKYISCLGFEQNVCFFNNDVFIAELKKASDADKKKFGRRPSGGVHKV